MNNPKKCLLQKLKQLPAMSGEIFIFKHWNKQGNNGWVFYHNGKRRLFYLSPVHEADGLFKDISCRLKTG